MACNMFTKIDFVHVGTFCSMFIASSGVLTYSLDAMQVLGFIIDAMKKTFRKHINNTLQDAKTIMESAVHASSLQLQDTVEEGGVPFWKEAYYSLVMIEKMLKQFPDLNFGKDFEVYTHLYDANCSRPLRSNCTFNLSILKP